MTVRGSIRRERLARDLATQGIRQPSVLDAMRSIPRERFVDEALRRASPRGKLLGVHLLQIRSSRLTETSPPPAGPALTC